MPRSRAREAEGGGIYGNVSAENCQILDNRAYQNGGGAYRGGTFYNCLFTVYYRQAGRIARLSTP